MIAIAAIEEGSGTAVGVTVKSPNNPAAWNPGLPAASPVPISVKVVGFAPKRANPLFANALPSTSPVSPKSNPVKLTAVNPSNVTVPPVTLLIVGALTNSTCPLLIAFDAAPPLTPVPDASDVRFNPTPSPRVTLVLNVTPASEAVAENDSGFPVPVDFRCRYWSVSS